MEEGAGAGAVEMAAGGQVADAALLELAAALGSRAQDAISPELGAPELT
jgi:hypothetical protein